MSLLNDSTQTQPVKAVMLNVSFPPDVRIRQRSESAGGEENIACSSSSAEREASEGGCCVSRSSCTFKRSPAVCSERRDFWVCRGFFSNQGLILQLKRSVNTPHPPLREAASHFEDDSLMRFNAADGDSASAPNDGTNHRLFTSSASFVVPRLN